MLGHFCDHGFRGGTLILVSGNVLPPNVPGFFSDSDAAGTRPAVVFAEVGNSSVLQTGAVAILVVRDWLPRLQGDHC